MTALADPRVGIIRTLDSVAVPPQFPRTFVMRRSVLADTSRFCRWPADASGAGYAFGDEQAATAAATGEAVERYCGNLVPPGLRHACYHELRADGVDAVDPRSVALFSAEQYRTPGFPFIPMDRDLPMTWARGVDLATEGRVLVPANPVWVSLPGANLPHTNPIIQAGLAAGRSRAAAEASALTEIIERDTMTLAWHGRAGLREIRLPASLRGMMGGPLAALHTRCYAFANEFGLHVLGALVRDDTTGYLSLGMGVAADPLRAVRKAMAEALQLQLFIAGYDDPDGPYMRAARQPASPLQPWRPDRDYLAGRREDLRDVVDYNCHLQLYLDPAMQRRFEAELADTVTGTVALEDLPDLAAGGDNQGDVRKRITDAGHRIISVDVTTDDVRACGWHAVRVMVPGLYSNSAAGLPFLGGDRLTDSLAGRPRRDLPLPH